MKSLNFAPKSIAPSTLSGLRIKCIIVAIFTVMCSAHAAAQWTGVGGLLPTTALSAAIAVTRTGTPYVIYVSPGAGYYAQVVKYNGSSWVDVGASGFSGAPINYCNI